MQHRTLGQCYSGKYIRCIGYEGIVARAMYHGPALQVCFAGCLLPRQIAAAAEGAARTRIEHKAAACSAVLEHQAASTAAIPERPVGLGDAWLRSVAHQSS